MKKKKGFHDLYKFVLNGKLKIIAKRCHEQAMYSQQQNKWNPQRCLLAHFEATF